MVKPQWLVSVAMAFVYIQEAMRYLLFGLCQNALLLMHLCEYRSVLVPVSKLYNLFNPEKQQFMFGSQSDLLIKPSKTAD